MSSSSGNADNPWLSVILVGRNQQQSIEQSICSVIDQGDPGIELIVADAGSTDQTRETMRLYEDDLHACLGGPRATQAQAINEARQRCHGQWVLILAMGDVMLPGGTGLIANEIRNASRDPDVIACDWQRIDDHDNSIGQVSARLPESLFDHLLDRQRYLDRAPLVIRADRLNQLAALDSQTDLAWQFELIGQVMLANADIHTLARPVAGGRERRNDANPSTLIAAGIERLNIARQLSAQLVTEQKQQLIEQYGRRRTVYDVAAAEVAQSSPRQFLWTQLLRRPWWLASPDYTQALLADRPVSRPMAA